MATVEASLCAAVTEAEPGSSGIAAATRRPAPAIASEARPPRDPGPNEIASATSVTPTSTIASSTGIAAGSPGSARRLIVRASGS